MPVTPHREAGPCGPGHVLAAVFVLVLGLAPGLALAGCSTSAGGQAPRRAAVGGPTSRTTSTGSQRSSAARATGAARSDGAARSHGAAPTAARAAAATATRDVSDLGLRDGHQNGVTLTVTAVTTTPTTTVLAVSAVNGGTRPVRLNGIRTYLVDDRGGGHDLESPPADDELRVAAGGRRTARLVYTGGVDPAATTLTLKMNVFAPDDPIDVTDRFGGDTLPALLIRDIPVPTP